MSDAAINGLAGAFGGMIAQILTYPLQAINTRQQTDQKLKNSHKTSLNSNNRVASHNAILEMYQILMSGGVQELYRGLGPSLVGTACSQGVYYYFYQLFRTKAVALSSPNQKTHDSIGMVASLVVAALAGCVNVLMTNPIWVVVTRMQTQSKYKDIEIVRLKNKEEEGERNEEKKSKKRPSLLEHLQKETKTSTKRHQNALEISLDLYNEAGLLGFWKGVVPTLIMTSGSGKSLSAIQIFGIGALAKLGATVVTYPLLVVKSRLQAKQKEENGFIIKYSGTLDTIRKMLVYEGIGCFYKGMRTKIVQSVFASAVLFMIKEEIVKFTKLLVAYYSKPKPKKAVK